jgi:hypothetical protein
MHLTALTAGMERLYNELLSSCHRRRRRSMDPPPCILCAFHSVLQRRRLLTQSAPIASKMISLISGDVNEDEIGSNQVQAPSVWESRPFYVFAMLCVSFACHLALITRHTRHCILERNDSTYKENCTRTPEIAVAWNELCYE